MKNKRNLSRLVQQFLKNSPRSLAQKRNLILPPEYRHNITNLPTDQQYVKNFIVNIDCSYMYNYFGPPTINNQQKSSLHKQTFINPLSLGLVRRKAVEINDQSVDKKTILFELIKNINKDKNTVIRYTQFQQFLLNLSIQQTQQYKKFIVYFYKWLLTEKHSFPPNSIQQQLCQQTSQIIIKKIYQSHEKGDYGLLKNTQQELLTIEILQKAREMKRNNQPVQAKQTYQTVYFARLTQEIDRLQALEYICQRCKEELDTKFLQNMIDKIKQGLGLKSHQKTLLKTITQIKDLQTPFQHLTTPLATQVLDQKTHQNLQKIILDNEKPSQKPLSQRKKKTLSRDIIDGTKNG